MVGNVAVGVEDHQVTVLVPLGNTPMQIILAFILESFFT